MDIILDTTLEKYKLFHKSDATKLLFAHNEFEKCYLKKCFKSECGCESVQNCDLEDGKTFDEIIKTLSLVEITKEEFTKLWTKCEK